MTRPHATRHPVNRTLKVDGLYILLALMVGSAVIVIAVGYVIAVWFLSLGTYIEMIS